MLTFSILTEKDLMKSAMGELLFFCERLLFCRDVPSVNFEMASVVIPWEFFTLKEYPVPGWRLFTVPKLAEILTLFHTSNAPASLGRYSIL